MAVQPTREDALDTGTLNQYAHLYDVERLRQDIDTGEHGTASDGDKYGVVKGSDSITVEDGVAKVNPGIFGDGVKVEDGQVTFDLDWLFETLGIINVNYTISDSLIYSKNGHLFINRLNQYTTAPGVIYVKTDEHFLAFFADGSLGVNTDKLGEHLAGDALYYDSEQGLMVKVGDGLHIQNDEIDIDQDKLPLASETNRGTVKVGSGLSIDAEGVLSAAGSFIDGVIVKKRTDFTVTEAGVVDEVPASSTDALLVMKSAGNGSYSYGVMKTGLYFRLSKTYAVGTKLTFDVSASVDGVKAYFGNQRIAMLRHNGNILFASSFNGQSSYKLTFVFDITETFTAGDYVYVTFI